MPSVLRSFLAVFAGYVTMAIVVVVLTLIAVKTMGLKTGHPTPGYLALNLVYSAAAGVLGGWVTGVIARGRRLAHGYVLAAVILILGVLSYWRYRGQQPLWYQATATLVPAACALVAAGLSGRSLPQDQNPLRT